MAAAAILNLPKCKYLLSGLRHPAAILTAYRNMTEIGKFHETFEIFKIQDGGGRHLGLLITSAWVERFACNLNYVYPDVTETSI